ncbi:MAG: alpha/beta hydrolase [Gammaproteobacteria bacterium]
MIALLITYLLILLAVFLLQRKLIYYPDRYTAEQQTELMARFNLRPWPSALNVRGMMSSTPLENAKGTVLVFHGNAGTAPYRHYYIEALQRLGYRVILAEYPGYGARSGSPSEHALIEDGIESALLVREQFKAPLFLCGESLGSGVIAGVIKSEQVTVKGLLLISPFASLGRVAQHHYWFFLGKLLTRDKFDNIENLRGYRGNVAVTLAEEDEIIPNQHTLILFKSLPTRKKLWKFEHAGHNNLPLEAWQPWWREAMQFIDY